MRRPTDSDVITLAYGATTPPYSPSNPHAGVDYRARPAGQNIYAAHPGKVTIAGSLGTCGIAVEIDGGRFKSRLCHNSEKLVSVGEQVSEGQVVAKSGMTGSAQAVHCHWILWDNGVRVDGSKYVNDNGGNMADKYTEDEFYKAWRMGALNDPNQAEASNPAYRDPKFLNETLWNNIGKKNYEYYKVNKVFNEGDRKNFATMLYGKDGGQGKDQVGKLFKDGAYGMVGAYTPPVSDEYVKVNDLYVKKG